MGIIYNVFLYYLILQVKLTYKIQYTTYKINNIIII